MVTLNAISAYCNQQLKSQDFDDYCPNGLQVEAGQQVGKIVSGVLVTNLDADVVALTQYYITTVQTVKKLQRNEEPVELGWFCVPRIEN